jgi:hypothetical protein
VHQISHCKEGTNMNLETTRDLEGTGPAEARELAQRQTGTVEVLLLWHPELDQVELSVRDSATDVSFHLRVAPGDAIDAFYHPYAYAARPASRRVDRRTQVPR